MKTNVIMYVNATKFISPFVFWDCTRFVKDSRKSIVDWLAGDLDFVLMKTYHWICCECWNDKAEN